MDPRSSCYDCPNNCFELNYPNLWVSGGGVGFLGQRGGKQSWGLGCLVMEGLRPVIS